MVFTASLLRRGSSRSKTPSSSSSSTEARDREEAEEEAPLVGGAPLVRTHRYHVEESIFAPSQRGFIASGVGKRARVARTCSGIKSKASSALHEIGQSLVPVNWVPPELLYSPDIDNYYQPYIGAYFV